MTWNAIGVAAGRSQSRRAAAYPNAGRLWQARRCARLMVSAPAWRKAEERVVLNPASPLTRLLNGPLRPGVVTWIGLRPARRADPTAVAQATLDPDCGLIGDHYRSGGQRTRQVTLIQGEHLTAIAGYLGLTRLPPEQLRRNIVVDGINLLALQGTRFRLGPTVLEATGACHPCSRMEEVLGPGGYNAVRGHGGITARIVTGGQIQLGDAVTREDPDKLLTSHS
jgi:MOSC domain-containing protein YiiM